MGGRGKLLSRELEEACNEDMGATEREAGGLHVESGGDMVV